VVPLTRRAPKSLACASGSEEPSACCIVTLTPEGVCRFGAARAVPLVAPLLRRAPVGPASAPVGLRRAPLVRQSTPMPPNPVESDFASPPKRGGSVGPVVRFSRSSEEAWGCRAGDALRSALPKRGGVGAGTSAAGGVIPPRRAGGAGTCVGPLPRKGVGSRQAPVGLADCEGQAHRCPLFRRASPFRRWVSALHCGDSSRWRTLAAPPRRGCQVCFRSPGAEALGEFSQVPSGGQSVARRSALVLPGCSMCRFPSGPKAFWSPLRRSSAGPTRPFHRGGAGSYR
jgi:hypothetical protein